MKLGKISAASVLFLSTALPAFAAPAPVPQSGQAPRIVLAQATAPATGETGTPPAAEIGSARRLAGSRQAGEAEKGEKAPQGQDAENPQAGRRHRHHPARRRQCRSAGSSRHGRHPQPVTPYGVAGKERLAALLFIGMGLFVGSGTRRARR